MWSLYKVVVSWTLALSFQVLTTLAWGSAEPQFVALGRTQPSPGASDGLVKLPQTISWPATTLTTSFHGTEVYLNLSTPPHQTDVLSLQARGLSMPLEISVTGSSSVTKTCLVGVPAQPCAVQGLPLGNYSLAIRKVSEALSGEAIVQSIDIGTGRFLPVDLPAQLRTGRRILFIGDSFTAGLGILGNATCQYYDAVGTLENAYLTYASLAALQLDSDYQLIAWSGAGVEVQTQFDVLRTLMVPSAESKGAGGSASTSMGSFGSPKGSTQAQGTSEAIRVFPTDPQLFQRAVAGDPASVYNFSSWVPQVILFAGGVNDFAAGLPHETDWVNGYASFIQNVTDIYNNTEVVLMALPYVGQLSGLPEALNAGQNAAGESSGAYQAYMSRLYTELQLRGVPRAHFLALSADGLDASTWCQFHPNLKAHQVMGEQLVAFMRATLPHFANGSFPRTVNFASA